MDYARQILRPLISLFCPPNELALLDLRNSITILASGVLQNENRRAIL